MATLEQRIRALEQRRLSGHFCDAGCDMTDAELEGVIQMLVERGEWIGGGDEQDIVMGMSDADLGLILMPLIEEWRAARGHA
jgi:hypothetical protein